MINAGCSVKNDKSYDFAIILHDWQAQGGEWELLVGRYAMLHTYCEWCMPLANNSHQNAAQNSKLADNTQLQSLATSRTQSDRLNILP